jgi:RNA polymerase sigma-70 factor (ECF subfamily)
MALRRPVAKVARKDADERLLVEAAQKEPAKFADLYELHFDRIYAFVARRVNDRDKAEDVTSEVFHKALASLKDYEWRGLPFAAWLFRIAANLIADHFKRAGREAANISDSPEPGRDPEQEATEQTARLFRFVDRLPAEQKRVIFQRFVEQRSVKEIAQQLGRSEGAVKQLQFRALEKLRAQMEGARA